MSLRVNEIYGPTIQGEGKNVGQPVLFLRLAGCNLHCSWCDTWYTWNYEGTKFDNEHTYADKVKMEDEVHIMSVDEVVTKLDRFFLDTGVSHLVISGGEPMIQQQVLSELCYKLKKDLAYSWYIEIETNGVTKPIPKLDEHIDQYNCSPKLANSGNHLKLRRNKDSLNSLAAKTNCYFKFVVSDKTDIDEVLGIILDSNIRHDKVYLMPLGHTKELQEQKQKEVVQMCIDNGFNYSPRLHVDLWGSRRGV